MSEQRMSVGERDKKMNEIASRATEVFCEKYSTIPDDIDGLSAESMILHTVPYLTVRSLQRLEVQMNQQSQIVDRQEKALQSLERDSFWIKWSAIATTALTVALMGLTFVLAWYAKRLDHEIDTFHKILETQHERQPEASPKP